MRDYILTPGERDIIKKYIEHDEKLEGFYVLLCRARKHDPKQVTEDEELLNQFLIKAGEK